MKRPIVLLFLLLLACASASSVRNDENQLLAIHKAVLQAHMDRDAEALVSVQGEPFVLVSRGDVNTISKDDLRSFFGPYLARTTFTAYRDVVDPIVRVSPDAQLGWVIAKVEVTGTQDGKPLNFVSAWIELYEKRNGRWYGIGNVSNFKPEAK